MKVNLNSKSKIYLIIFIAFAVVVLAAASYAYLTNTQGVGDLLEANTTTGNAGAFTMHVYDPCEEEGADPNCVSDTSINFDVSALQMSQLNVTNEPTATDNQTLIVNLISSNIYEGARCTYDLVWVWDSDDKYTTSDVELPYTAENGITYPYEFSVMINDDKSSEIDLSDLEWSEDGTTAVLVDNKIITNASLTEATTQTWKFTVNMYNIEAAQRNLFQKNFQAHIEMQNYECVNEAIADGTMHYMVKQDDGTYVEKQASALATAATGLKWNYSTPVINEDLSYCKRNGSYTHNASTNTFSPTVEGDECYLYIDSMDTTQNFAAAIVRSAGQTVGTGQVVNENGYRFEGSSPNNFVCFGSDATTCPTDNLYRVIGVFNEYNNSSGTMAQSNVVKLIKHTFYTSGSTSTFAWNTNGNSNNTSSATTAFQYNYYPTSNVYTTLNTTYYNALGSTWQQMITKSRWWLKTDAATSTNYSYTAEQFYNYERNGAVPYGQGSYDANVSLMYASDHGYAVLASDCARTVSPTSYQSTNSSYANCAIKNWLVNDMFANQWEWILNRFPYNSGSSYRADVLMVLHQTSVSSGYGNLGNTYAYSTYAIRPSFYLDSDVIVVSGAGTQSNPYYLSM